jgi:hypothetical protein
MSRDEMAKSAIASEISRFGS